MRPRVHAAGVIARRRIYETLIGPGYYLALSIGLLVAYFLISGFVKSIDSSGFNYQLNPLYDLIGRSLQGAFGATFVDQLFGEGPFLLVLIVSISPVVIYLAISSVLRFGLEKKVGAIELLSYGPVDGTAYFIAFLIKDILITLFSILALLFFLWVSALVNNLLLGPTVICALVLMFFLPIVIYAYGILASSLTDNSASAIALLLVVLVFFLVIMMGSFTIVSSYVRSLAGVLSWIIQWLSPFFYWDLGMKALAAGHSGAFGLSLLLLSVLSTVILVLGHISMRIRGVKA